LNDYAAAKTADKAGDVEFLTEVKRTAPNLHEIAQYTLQSIRRAGVDGALHKEGPRWVNRPKNSFTLKIQPRVGNLFFTLYGNPDAFDAGDFLKRDQNSYSAGWVKNDRDADLLAKLSKLAHNRKRG
jgi:hypothetical protein